MLHLGRFLYAALIVVGIALISAAAWQFLSGQRDYAAARREYSHLRGVYAGDAETVSHHAGPLPQDDPIPGAEPVDSGTESTKSDLRLNARTLSQLTEINPDFAGWITIEGTAVDYPVVRGPDNDVYISTLFTGWTNPSGSIFMDYRCEQGFNGSVCILYGHNMRDGSMFAALSHYLDPLFLTSHPFVTITTPEGEIMMYRVVNARHTDIRNKAYSLEYSDVVAASGTFDGASGEPYRFLILSTCLNGSDKEARLLVFCETFTEPAPENS